MKLVGLICAVLVALMAGVLPPERAAASDLVPTTVTLSAPGSARITSSVQVTVTLDEVPSGASESPLRGQSVAIDEWDGSSWSAVAEVLTGADGTASATVKIAGSSNRFRATYAGDATHAPADSPVATVSGTRYPTSLTLTGAVKVVDERIAHLGIRWRTDTGLAVPGVVGLFARTAGGEWTLLRQVVLGGDGAARVAVSPRVDTRYRVRGSAGTWWNAATSPVHPIDNVPPMAPIVLPRAAPRPQSLPPQPRAVGTGANISVGRIPAAIWGQMTGITWHRGCPVGRSALRLMHINYWGFDGYRHRGELVVNVRAVREFRGAFNDLYAGQFPIRAMYRPDRFGFSRRSGGGNDFAAMRHDDTSAFNCRWVTGNPGVRSPHSYGFAIDLNTWENPYRSDVGLLPDSWWMAHSNPRYAWRSRSHPVVRIMLKNGFHWTYGRSDTQHFDA